MRSEECARVALAFCLLIEFLLVGCGVVSPKYTTEFGDIVGGWNCEDSRGKSFSNSNPRVCLGELGESMTKKGGDRLFTLRFEEVPQASQATQTPLEVMVNYRKNNEILSLAPESGANPLKESDIVLVREPSINILDSTNVAQDFDIIIYRAGEFSRSIRWVPRD